MRTSRPLQSTRRTVQGTTRTAGPRRAPPFVTPGGAVDLRARSPDGSDVVVARDPPAQRSGDGRPSAPSVPLTRDDAVTGPASDTIRHSADTWEAGASRPIPGPLGAKPVRNRRLPDGSGRACAPASKLPRSESDAVRDGERLG